MTIKNLLIVQEHNNEKNVEKNVSCLMQAIKSTALDLLLVIGLMKGIPT